MINKPFSQSSYHPAIILRYLKLCQYFINLGLDIVGNSIITYAYRSFCRYFQWFFNSWQYFLVGWSSSSSLIIALTSFNEIPLFSSPLMIFCRALSKSSRSKVISAICCFNAERFCLYCFSILSKF